MSPPRHNSTPDSELPCIEHGMRLETCDKTMTELRADSRDTRDRLLKLETEWRSNARLFAQYVIPIILIVAAEMLRTFVFRR